MDYSQQLKIISQLDLPREIKQTIFRDFIFDTYKNKYNKVLTQLKTYPFKQYGFKHCYIHRNIFHKGNGYFILISCDDLTVDNYNYNFLEEENTHRIGERNNVYPFTWKHPYIINKQYLGIMTNGIITNEAIQNRFRADL